MRSMRRSSGSTRESRWAGVALVDAQHARLDRRDARRLGPAIDLAAPDAAGRARCGCAPTETAASRCWSKAPSSSSDFQRDLIAASRGARTDWASRYILPLVEEFATEQLMETPRAAGWLIWAALALTLGGAFCFTRGWLGAGLGLLVALDAARPGRAPPRDASPAAAAGADAEPRSRCGPPPASRLLALGWWEMRHGGGWGALVAAARRPRLSPKRRGSRSDRRCRRRRSVAVLAPQRDLRRRSRSLWPARGPPICSRMLLYAALSFFIVQHVRHLPPS